MDKRATKGTNIGILKKQNQSLILSIIKEQGPNAHFGVILSPPNFPGWHNVPLKKLIEEEFEISAFIDNDANVAALGEKWFGNGQGIDNFIYISLDLGIGAGALALSYIFKDLELIEKRLGVQD